MPASDVAALILAGGRATRMGGIAKHELVIEGATIFERQCAVLAPRVAEILVSSRTDVRGFRTVRDTPEATGSGPLAGIAAGLAATRHTWLLVIAGDMPYITDALIDRLIGARGPDLDAIGIHHAGRPEPLVSLLHARCLAVVERRLAASELRASSLLTDAGLRVHWITDADPAALRNLNSPADLPK